MDYLWTPWRHGYISDSRAGRECVFCAAAGAAPGPDSLIVHRARWNFIILNRFPYTNGHLMVVPYRHAAMLSELNDETLVEMIRLARQSELVLREVYQPDGLNLGLNLGRSAGAGVAGHVHLHALPRWTGDVNFMTALGETRVLPEELEVTWEKLSRAFRALPEGHSAAGEPPEKC